MLNLFQHLIPLFLFLFLAYAELNVNFVEGFAVFLLRVSMCFARLNGFAVSVATPFQWHYLSPVPLGTMLR